MDSAPPVASSSAEPENGETAGVDRTLIRWMLSLTPTERLTVLQQFADQTVEIRDAGRPLR